MSAVRQDYILREIELLRRFVARLIEGKDHAGLEQALQAAMNLQEKLFAMPPAEFLRQPIDGQIKTLLAGESRAAGQAKCLTYATLLRETAGLYDLRRRDDLAAGARQLALHVTLQLGLDDPVDPAAVRELVTDLLAAVDPHELYAPVREMLDDYIRRED